MNPSEFLRFSKLAPVLLYGMAIGLPLSTVHADEIAWTATPSQTSAWLSPSGWQGGAMPLAGDIAVFNNVGSATLGYSMYHTINPTPGQGNIGAVWLRNTRTTNDLAIETSSAGSNVFNYHGASIDGVDNVIIRSDSTRNLQLRALAGASFVKLTDNRESRIVLTSSGNVSIRSTVSGNNSQLVINASGSGKVELGGAGGTYTGGTRIEAGTLIISADNAAGTGTVVNQGGTLEVGSDILFTNTVEHESAAAVYRRGYLAGASYGGVNLRAAGSLQSTVVRLLGGATSLAGTLEATFSNTGLAVNDGERGSAVLNLTLVQGGDLFVISMQGSGAGGMVGWLDGGEWKNAVKGNQFTGSEAIQGFEGSFAASGATASADYLGSWGYDAATQTGWAVLDHGGAFAVMAIPEPGSISLMAVSGVLLLGGYLKVAGARR